MKFSTLILLGLVLVVAYASADETTAATTTSTTVKPKSCDTNELNKLKNSICQKLIQTYSYIPLIGLAYVPCQVFVENAVNILKCDCGRAA